MLFFLDMGLAHFQYLQAKLKENLNVDNQNTVAQEQANKKTVKRNKKN